MRSVISGSAGLAFVLDGNRALLLHADAPEAPPVELAPDDFHRLFAERRT